MELNPEYAHAAVDHSAAIIGMLVGAILGLAAGLGMGLGYAAAMRHNYEDAPRLRRKGPAAGTASAEPVKPPKERILEAEPWRHDPAYANREIEIDEKRGVAIIIDDYASESHEEPLDEFLLQYKVPR